jgi:hypothetical protein
LRRLKLGRIGNSHVKMFDRPPGRTRLIGLSFTPKRGYRACRTFRTLACRCCSGLSRPGRGRGLFNARWWKHPSSRHPHFCFRFVHAQQADRIAPTLRVQ